MAKYYKNTHCTHQLSNGSKMTKCGIRVDEFTDLMDKDTMMKIPSPRNESGFTPHPYNEERHFPLCKTCDK